MLNNGWFVGVWFSFCKLINCEFEYKVLGNLEIECYVDVVVVYIVDFVFCIFIGILDLII